MNGLRSVREAKINFLFFQDIITCVMGILILVTLILSLNLDAGQPVTPEEQQLDTQLRQLKQALAEIQRQNETAQQQALTVAALPDLPTLESELAVVRQQAANIEREINKPQQPRPTADTQSLADAQRQIAPLKSEISATRDELAKARVRTNTVYIVPSPATEQSAREPVAFVVGADIIEVKHLNRGDSQKRALSSANDLRALLEALSPEREYIVFYFRPTGAKWFEAFRDLARSLGFAVGYDAVEENKEIIFSTR